MTRKMKRRTTDEMDFISCLMSRDSHPLILHGGLTINQTQRPVEIGTPDGNRTHISQTESGRSLAVELRVIRWASGVIEWGALHAGNRTRTTKVFATDGTPSLWWRINDQLRPI